jgi:hypothetical protein
MFWCACVSSQRRDDDDDTGSKNAGVTCVRVATPTPRVPKDDGQLSSVHGGRPWVLVPPSPSVSMSRELSPYSSSSSSRSSVRFHGFMTNHSFRSGVFTPALSPSSDTTQNPHLPFGTPQKRERSRSHSPLDNVVDTPVMGCTDGKRRSRMEITRLLQTVLLDNPRKASFDPPSFGAMYIQMLDDRSGAVVHTHRSCLDNGTFSACQEFVVPFNTTQRDMLEDISLMLFMFCGFALDGYQDMTDVPRKHQPRLVEWTPPHPLPPVLKTKSDQ